MAIKPKQNCITCPHQQKCWAANTSSGNPISKENVIINKLICCLQLGIKRDQATKVILGMFKPGMIKLIMYAKQTGLAQNMDVGQLLTDMQSVAIEYLIRDYKIGDRGRATPYLFDPKQGYLTKWLLWITSKNRKYHSHYELFDPSGSSNDDDSSYADYVAENSTAESNLSSLAEGHGLSQEEHENTRVADIMEMANEIIEDGHTLNSNEYRVLKYCMHNANESNRARNIDGLHIYLGKIMGVSRPRITRLFKRSREKLLQQYKQRIEEEGTF